MIGGINKGWTVAKRLLQYERTSIGGMGGSVAHAGKWLGDYAKDYAGENDGKIANHSLRSQVLSHRITDHAYGLTVRRVGEETKAGVAPTFMSSMFKYYGTEQNKDRLDLMMSMMGTQAAGWEGDTFAANELGTTRAWLRSKANSIEGGTSEVQLNIIAKRILGLPD